MKIELEDGRLVALSLEGNERAFEELVNRYQNTLYWYICSMGHNIEDAKGITQATFMKAYEALASLKDPFKFKGWLFSIGRNRARNWHRKNNRYVSWPEQGVTGENTYGSEAVTPESLVLREEDLKELKEALDRIPCKYKAILGHYICGLSYLDIANRTGLKKRTVETRIYRGRKLLKDALQKTQ